MQQIFVYWFLYPVTLSNSYSLHLLVRSLGFSVYNIMSSASFILHLQFGCLLFYLCLVALARTFSAVLKKSGESGQRGAFYKQVRS